MKFLQEMIAKKKQSHEAYVPPIEQDFAAEATDRTAQELHSAAWETVSPAEPTPDDAHFAQEPALDPEFAGEAHDLTADDIEDADDFDDIDDDEFDAAPQDAEPRMAASEQMAFQPNAAASQDQADDDAPDLDDDAHFDTLREDLAATANAAAEPADDFDEEFEAEEDATLADTFEALELSSKFDDAPEMADATPVMNGHAATSATLDDELREEAILDDLRADLAAEEPETDPMADASPAPQPAMQATPLPDPEPEFAAEPEPEAEFQDTSELEAEPELPVETLHPALAETPATQPAEVDASMFFDKPAEDRIMERTNQILAKTNPEVAAAAGVARKKIWDVQSPGNADQSIQAAPQADAEQPRRRAGRVKTRLLGFHGGEDPKKDVFAKGQATPTANAPTMFPVGWIIVIDGPGKGASFPLVAGASKIGRGEGQVVRLDFGDSSISRDNHAAVAYDDEQRQFFLGHGGKANLVRLNNMPVLSTEPLNDGDKVRIGETTLRFVALCGPDFAWDSADEANARHAAGS